MIEPLESIKILRNADLLTCSFTNNFKGFEQVDAVRRIFGERTEEVLRNLKVKFTEKTTYMKISDTDGHLVVNPYYLNNGDVIDIYLDIIHELVHVRQFMEGKELFDRDCIYIERPTEVEAYRVTVEEARALGLSDERICKYLKSELLRDEDLMRLVEILNINVKRLPVEPHIGFEQ